MDVPAASSQELIRPWRRATLVASLVAAVELVLLLVAAMLLLAKPLSNAVQHRAQTAATKPAAKEPAKKTQLPPTARRTTTAAPKAKLTRAETRVVVLNGNGRQGAAADGASRLQRFGYGIAGTGNATRQDYAATVVMYRPGFRAEAMRLAGDLKVKVVGPLDGMKPSALMGGQLAIVIGA